MRQKTELSIGELQQSLGYEFKDYELLIQALTRRSAVNSRMQSTADNERLEFLGDKVLGLVVSDILMQKYPSYNEGELTKEVSALVRNKNGPLTGIAKKIRLGDCIIMDRGEEVTNRGRVHNKVLADTMEAVIGAIFIDSGKNYEAIKRFIGDHWCGLSQSDVLFKLAEDLHTQGDTESLYPKIIEAIKDGVDVRVKNHEGKTIFHLIDDPGIIRWILNTQKNLVGVTS